MGQPTRVLRKYNVRWEIDVEAFSPELAAHEALTLMQIPTWATTFEVYNQETDSSTTVDLGDVKDLDKTKQEILNG